MNLGRLLTVDEEGWNPDRMGPNAAHHYACAESFVDLLLHGDKWKPVFSRIRKSVLQGTGGRLLGESEIAKLETAWREHAASLAK